MNRPGSNKVVMHLWTPFYSKNRRELSIKLWSPSARHALSNAASGTIALRGCHYRFQYRGGDSQPWAGEDNYEPLLGHPSFKNHLSKFDLLWLGLGQTTYRPQQTLVRYLKHLFRSNFLGTNIKNGQQSAIDGIHLRTQVHDEQTFLVPRMELLRSQPLILNNKNMQEAFSRPFDLKLELPVI
jgi:hypothetical protein